MLYPTERPPTVSWRCTLTCDLPVATRVETAGEREARGRRFSRKESSIFNRRLKSHYTVDIDGFTCFSIFFFYFFVAVAVAVAVGLFLSVAGSQSEKFDRAESDTKDLQMQGS